MDVGVNRFIQEIIGAEKLDDGSPLYGGEYSHTLDSQCRVTLPSAWRSENASRMVLFPGRNRDLMLYPYEMFQNFILRARPGVMANPQAQMAFAQIGRVVREVRPDKQGRIKLEWELLQAIGVEKELLMIGSLTHIKLCAPQNWQPVEMNAVGVFLDEIQKLNDANTDRVGDLLMQLTGKGN